MARIRLQERDLDILHSLSTGRYLTVQAIEWLHFPTWRTRWAQHQANGNGAYYPLPNVYRRLEGLRAGGMVQTITRTAERASLVFTRLADVYALTEAGADLLIARRGLDDVDYTPLRPKSLSNLEHSIAIAQVYAAVRSALDAEEARRLALHDWRGDHLLARDYDRLTVATHRSKLPVLPDATFLLASASKNRRYFVELDRGTRPLDSWREKVRAYEAYRESAALMERYGVKDFVLVVVAPTLRRLTRIAEMVAKYWQGSGSEYVFIVSSDIHPISVRTGFRRITDAVMHRRMVAGRWQEVPQVTFGDHPLWTVR